MKKLNELAADYQTAIELSEMSFVMSVSDSTRILRMVKTRIRAELKRLQQAIDSDCCPLCRESDCDCYCDLIFGNPSSNEINKRMGE